MYIELSTNEVAQQLLSDSYAGWSDDAAYSLASYYEDLEQDTGKPIQLDVVAIRCEFSELDIDQLQADYGYLAENAVDYDREIDVDQWSIDNWSEFLREYTTVIELSNGNRLLVAEF